MSSRVREVGFDVLSAENEPAAPVLAAELFGAALHFLDVPAGHLADLLGANLIRVVML
jgi:hypothetical protein